jgi:hypothetical protein
MKKEIVVNYYNSLEFKEVLKDIDEEINVIVYNKSGQVLSDVPNEKKLENIGREGHTYLNHIITNYNSLADITIFIQDDFYNHLFTNDYFINNLRLNQNNYFYQFPCSWRKGPNAAPFSRTVKNGYLELPPVTNNNAIKDFANKFEIYLPDVYNTEICAHFLVSKQRILRHSKKKYERILEWLLKDDLNGYTLEHCWKILFM